MKETVINNSGTTIVHEWSNSFGYLSSDDLLKGNDKVLYDIL